MIPENATYTAAEVKVLAEVALRLGRKEALDEVEAALIAEGGTQRAIRIVQEARTDPAGHSDLPPTPEARRCSDCGFHPHADGSPWHHPKCSHAAPDLPEGRDQ